MMSGATSPGGDDREPQDRPQEGQQVSHTRVGQFLVQIRGVGGNVTVISGSVVAVTLVAVLSIVGLAWGRQDQPEKAAGPTPRSSSQPPLSVTRAATPIQGIRTLIAPDQAFVFFKPAAALPPMPPGYLEDPESIKTWGYGNGGVDADSTGFELVVQGNTAKSVVLTDLRIRIQQRAPTPRAIRVQGADGVDGRWAQVNLDKQAPGLEDMRNYSYSGDHPDQPWSFPLRVSQKAVEVIYLGANTRKYDCQWTAELHFVADGKPGVVPINNNGRPFRTVASANSTPYKVRFSDRRVVPGTYYGSSD